MSSCRVGLTVAKESAVFICDMQEKFADKIRHFPAIVEVASRLVNASKILDLPVIVTEQYPKGKLDRRLRRAVLPCRFLSCRFRSNSQGDRPGKIS